MFHFLGGGIAATFCGATTNKCSLTMSNKRSKGSGSGAACSSSPPEARGNEKRAISPWRFSPTIPRAIVLIFSSQAIDTPDAFNHLCNLRYIVYMIQCSYVMVFTIAHGTSLTTACDLWFYLLSTRNFAHGSPRPALIASASPAPILLTIPASFSSACLSASLR